MGSEEGSVEGEEVQVAGSEEALAEEEDNSEMHLLP